MAIARGSPGLLLPLSPAPSLLPLQAVAALPCQVAVRQSMDLTRPSQSRRRELSRKRTAQHTVWHLPVVSSHSFMTGTGQAADPLTVRRRAPAAALAAAFSSSGMAA
eukprot:scaffold1182_cov396-Prasinococcus_capsulatus_cf.AAC.22